MGKDSKIEWTDHTFNIAWGCTKVSELACANCYAEALAKRYGYPNLWGVDADRRVFGDKHWAEPLKWNAAAEKAGRRARVFCSSMADVFDNHPKMPAERIRLWELIKQTPWLNWLLLTKRIGNVSRMVPPDWIKEGFPDNVWIGISICNQPEAERDIPKLFTLTALVYFVSCEPLLGPLDLRQWLSGYPCLDWVITGGESGPHARPTNSRWVRSLRDQCIDSGTAFTHKQWGEWLPVGESEPSEEGPFTFGAGEVSMRVGKKKAGRLLDGRVWDEAPVP